MINNCSNKITGIGANEYTEADTTNTCTTNTYETPKGQAASTTGNIMGIYDMSGGLWENVMAVYNKTVESSGINFATLDAKYYDNYADTTETSACNNGICYGHALSETKGWYKDFDNFVSTSDSWLSRGGEFIHADYAGLFNYFNIGNGAGGTDYSFRVVITES